MSTDIHHIEVKGVAIVTNDMMLTSVQASVRGHQRRTVTYDGKQLPEIFVDEIECGDNIIFAQMSDENPDVIAAANLCINVQPKAFGSEIETKLPNDFTIEFSAEMVDPSKTVRDAIADHSKAVAEQVEKMHRRGFIQDVRPVNGEHVPLSEVVREFGENAGCNQLQPREKSVLEAAHIDHVVPLILNDAAHVTRFAKVVGRDVVTISAGEPVPPGKRNYLIAQYDPHHTLLRAFVLKDVLLSDYLSRDNTAPHIPDLPAGKTTWVPSSEFKDIDVTFINPETQNKRYVISLHCGMLVWNDPDLVIDRGDGEFVIVTPTTKVPTGPVKVLVLDYDTIPGTPTRMYTADDVDLSIANGNFKLEPLKSGVAGARIGDQWLHEVMPYTYFVQQNNPGYPRFRE